VELKEFIKATLTEIMDGVLDAQSGWTASGKKGGIAVVADQIRKSDFQDVSFDVAVTAENKTNEKAGGGIKVWGVGLSGEISGVKGSSSVSRIQFKVPVIMPAVIVELTPRSSNASLAEIGGDLG